jgi:DNA-binding winged helix-turn-helix (wHTH) protein
MRGVMPGGFEEVFEPVLICRLDLPDFSLGPGYNGGSGDGYLIYKFAEYSLDSDRLELRRGADLVAVEPQVLDLLQYIIRNRERVVSKDDLIEHVWNGRIVSDSTLTSRITAARQAVGDSGKEQRLIRTFSRKGLRFVGDVREQQRSEQSDSPARADAPAENDATRAAAIAPGSPERRQITIMVCDVIGSAVSTRLDPEDLRDVLAACHRRVREVIEQHDGFIAEYRTGRIVVYFGYPIAHEHDVERAVRA